MGINSATAGGRPLAAGLGIGGGGRRVVLVGRGVGRLPCAWAATRQHAGPHPRVGGRRRVDGVAGACGVLGPGGRPAGARPRGPRRGAGGPRASLFAPPSAPPVAAQGPRRVGCGFGGRWWAGSPRCRGGSRAAALARVLVRRRPRPSPALVVGGGLALFRSGSAARSVGPFWGPFGVGRGRLVAGRAHLLGGGRRSVAVRSLISQSPPRAGPLPRCPLRGVRSLRPWGREPLVLRCAPPAPTPAPSSFLGLGPCGCRGLVRFLRGAPVRGCCPSAAAAAGSLSRLPQ